MTHRTLLVLGSMGLSACTPVPTCETPPAMPSVADIGENPMLALVDPASADAIAGASGDWSDPCTWVEGRAPRKGARVAIPEGMTVTVDTVLDTEIDTLGIYGTLRFAPAVDTELRVDTIISTGMGRLEIGTEEEPIADEASARIVFTDKGRIDSDENAGGLRRGAVLMGPTRMHGAVRTHRTALAGGARAGDLTIALSTTPEGWSVGDEIVIAGTDSTDPESDERRVIEAIDGTTVTLDEALELDHIAPRDDLSVHVAHLTRNIELTSEADAIARRGHVMFMHNQDVDVRYARFSRLGRTDKRIPLDDWTFPELLAESAEPGAGENPRGSYAVHLHRSGVDPTTEPALVLGSVADDNPGWAYVNHSSSVDFIDNVSYDVVGGAFQTEAGDEVGSFVGNIAIRTVNPDYPLLDPEFEPVDIREDTQDFAFQGDAFWFHGGGVRVEDNIASGSSGHGFIYWTEGLREVGTGFDEMNHFLVENLDNGDLLPGVEQIDSWWVPLTSFRGNQTYSSTKGFAAYYIHATLFEDVTELSPAYLETVHSTLEDFTIWGVHTTGIHLENCERFTFRNVEILGSGDPESTGILTRSTVGDRTIWDEVSVSDFGVGMYVPSQGNVSILGGTWSNRSDFVIAPAEIEPGRPSDDRDVLIDVAFEPAAFDDAVHFELVGAQALAGEWFASNEEEAHRLFLVPDRIRARLPDTGVQRLYFDEQAGDVVPVPGDRIPDTASGSYVDDIADRTNDELFDALGLAFAGAVMPASAVEHPQVLGGQVGTPTSAPLPFPTCHFIDASDPPANTFDDYDFYACWDAEGGVGGEIAPFVHGTD